MFGMLESLTKAVVGVVTIPAPIIADVATLGGALTDKEAPYTYEAFADIIENISDAVKPK